MEGLSGPFQSQHFVSRQPGFQRPLCSPQLLPRVTKRCSAYTDGTLVSFRRSDDIFSLLLWLCPFLPALLLPMVFLELLGLRCLKSIYLSPPSGPWGIHVLVAPPEAEPLTPTTDFWPLSAPAKRYYQVTVKTAEAPLKLWTARQSLLYLHKEQHELAEHPRLTKYRIDLICPWKPLRQTHYLRSRDKL